MRVITFCSFKGGTAKTSTALHLGAGLAKYHSKRVLVIDFDPQANLSIGLGIGADRLETMVPVLQGKCSIQEVITPTSVYGLDLVAANTYLDGIESTSPLVTDLYAHERLRRAIAPLDYDYVLIDTPPSLGWLTQSAFFASQYSLICAIPEPYSVLALQRLREYHNAIGANHPVNVLGVLLTFWDARSITNEPFVNAIREAFPDKLFDSRIRRDVAVSRAILEGSPVFESAENSRASDDYQGFIEEFLQRMDFHSQQSGQPSCQNPQTTPAH
ncbi:MAG: ParA family protein [Chlamydiia bacterium]|nr:ParA family protein [Chlamydiia bacterium]